MQTQTQNQIVLKHIHDRFMTRTMWRWRRQRWRWRQCGRTGGKSGRKHESNWIQLKAVVVFCFCFNKPMKENNIQYLSKITIRRKTRISFDRTSSSCFYSSLYINILNSKYLLFFSFVVVVDVDVVVVFAHSEKLSVRVKYTKSWKKRKKSFCCVAFSLSSLFYLLPILLLLLYIFLLLLYWGCF